MARTISACITPSVHTSSAFLKYGFGCMPILTYIMTERMKVVKKKVRNPTMLVRPKIPAAQPLTIATNTRLHGRKRHG